MNSDLANILTAASVLLAIITALFGFFYPSIQKILDIVPKTQPPDNKKYYNEARLVARTKLLPLLIGIVSITTVFIPEFFIQISNTFKVLCNYGIKNSSYDTLTASFLTVFLFMTVLTVTLFIIGIQLLHKIKKLNPNNTYKIK